MSIFLHDADDDADQDDDNDDAKATAIPRVFSGNSRAKDMEDKTMNVLKNGLWIWTLITHFLYL